jgi:ribosomal protein L11 methyltransferase
MRYIEIIAAVETSQTESASDVLRAVTNADVWIETPFTQPDLESDAALSTNGTSHVHAYVAEGASPTLSHDIENALRSAGVPAALLCQTVAEEDWAESWKEHFHVEHFGRTIVVVPSWREYTPQPADVVLTLDPGMAFGTGQHETTRMCLEAIENAVRPGARVLDVGCGSGILSLAAAKLGAREVRAVDVDANCVRVTSDNAALNDVSSIVRAAAGSAGDAWPFDDDPPAAFDVVVANIIARVIIDLAAPLVDALAPGGRLIVSGIIAAREREVTDALAATDARIDSVRTMGEWRCIEATRA